MKSQIHIQDFIHSFVTWVKSQEDIHAVALVGSYARNTARDNSDIDLVLLCKQPDQYLSDISWVKKFGQVAKFEFEDYGKVKTLRVWYHGGLEVEYGLTNLNWASTPLDAGTKQVIEDGMMVLHEKRTLLSTHARDNREKPLS